MPTVRKHRSDHLIPLFAALLAIVGLIVIFAIGPQRANTLNNAFGLDYESNYFFMRQAVNVVLSVVLFVAAAKLPFKWVLWGGKALLGLGLLASAVLAIAGWAGSGLAQCAYGACRAIDLGITTFQPAELLKLGMLVYLAGFLGRRAAEGKLNKTETLLPLAVVSAVTLGFVMILQKDLGTSVVILAIILAMLVISGIKLWIIATASLAVLAIGVLGIVTSPHRMERLLTFSGASTGDAEEDDANAYHLEHAKMAIGTGGLFGVGIGNSVQATGYLPESINDSIFAIMGETFGFIGLVAVILVFSALLYRLLREVNLLPDPAARMLVAGVFAWIFAHVAVNMAAMIGVVPLTGITLPFLSYGGTSMIFVSMALGLAFGVSATTARIAQTGGPTGVKGEGSHENPSSRRRLGRAHHAYNIRIR